MPGQDGVEPAPVQPVLQQHHQPRLTTNDGDFEGNVGADLRRSAVRRAGRYRRRVRAELRARADLAGDQRGSERDRTDSRRQRHLPDDRPRRSSAASSRRSGPTRPLPALPNQVPGATVRHSAASASINRSSPDRHPAGLRLLQLPRRVAAGPHDRPQRLLGAGVPSPGTYNYAPITGQRDLLGYIRAPQPGSHRHRLRQQPVHRHRCLSVRQPAPARGHRASPRRRPRARRRSPSTPSAGSRAPTRRPGRSTSRSTARSTPTTLNANTVQLVDLGSNPGQPLNQDINLAGKLSYNSATDTLIINLACRRADAAEPTRTRSPSSAAARR